MDLIIRYIEQVVRHLPPNQREDITRELEGLIQDMLQKRCGEREPTNDDVEAVLLELGNPRILADNYRGTGRSLISSPFYDIYTLVLRIVLIAAGGGILIATAIELATSPPDNAWTALVMVFGRLYTVLISAFGFITLVFAINDRYNDKGRQALADDPMPWHPSQLPPKTVKSLLIPRSDPIAAIVFTVLFLILINFSQSLIGVHFKTDGVYQFIPLFSQNFLAYMPWINVSLAVAMLVEAVKLIAGRWNIPIVIMSLAQKTFSFIISLMVFSDPRIFTDSFFEWISDTFNQAFDLLLVKGQVSHWIVIILIIGFILDVLTTGAKGVRLLFKHSRRLPIDKMKT